MPISGFRIGDKVLTPAGEWGKVTDVRRLQGRERVEVDVPSRGYAGRRWFDAASLTMHPREAS